MTEAALASYSEGYRPLHMEVRGIQRRVIDDKAEIKRLETERRRLQRGSEYDDERARMDARIAELKEEITSIEARIPDNWKTDGNNRGVSRPVRPTLYPWCALKTPRCGRLKNPNFLRFTSRSTKPNRGSITRTCTGTPGVS